MSLPLRVKYEEAFLPVRARYIGKKYRVDGQVYTATRNSMDSGMEVNYLVTQTRGLLGVRGVAVQQPELPDQMRDGQKTRRNSSLP